MVLQLDPSDIEIENTSVGTIIHIFPEEKDPYKVTEDILRGLSILKDMDELVADWETAIKKEEQPEYIIMAFTELKRVLKDIDRHAEAQSLEIMEKIKKF